MNNQPLVSILINNYNYGHYLTIAIDSALNQTYENIEIIVVDDGSTDGSQQTIQEYGDKIIPVLKENGGQASAFNAGFGHSKGDILCFLDSDDYFIPTKIAKIVEVFKQNSEVGWCFHPLEFVDKDLKSLEIKQEYSGESGIYDITTEIEKGKLNGKLPFNSIATSGLCYRRSLLERLLPMSETIKITSDDYLKYAAFALTPGYALLEKLAWQKIHDNNAYTFRTDKDSLRGKINITTACLLKQKFPFMAKFTNNIFAYGLSLYEGKSQGNNDISSLINGYYSDLKLSEKLEIKLRNFYYSYKK